MKREQSWRFGRADEEEQEQEQEVGIDPEPAARISKEFRDVATHMPTIPAW